MCAIILRVDFGVSDSLLLLPSRRREGPGVGRFFMDNFTKNPLILSLSKDCFFSGRLRLRHKEKDSASTSSAWAGEGEGRFGLQSLRGRSKPSPARALRK